MKFKCKTTNLIYNFEFEVDIASMLKHPDYEPVPDNKQVADKEEVKVTSKKQTSTKVTPDESSIDG